MSTVLVTGGAGFIGSHTSVEPLNAGYDIIILDNFVNSKPESLKRIKKNLRARISNSIRRISATKRR